MKLSRIVWTLLVVLTLASCDTTTVNKGVPSAFPTVLPKPTLLHVTRPTVNNFPPLDRTVRDAVAVQRLYAPAYALPKPPHSGAVNCPSDIGMIYYMDFLRGSVLLQRMSLHATGCQLLQIGRAETRFPEEAFRSFFTKTIGIPSLVPGQSHP